MRISHFLTTLQNVRKAPDHPNYLNGNTFDFWGHSVQINFNFPSDKVNTYICAYSTDSYL